jgi:hypothetical protein
MGKQVSFEVLFVTDYETDPDMLRDWLMGVVDDYDLPAGVKRVDVLTPPPPEDGT